MLKTVDLKADLPFPGAFDAVGLVSVDGDVIAEADAWRLLSAEEVERLSKIRLNAPRRELRTSLVARRLWLAERLACAPDKVEIAHDSDGAPHLASGKVGELSFSRSGEQTLMALAKGKQVGVDIEQVKDIEWRPMLDMACTEEEASEVSAAVEGQGDLAPFYRMWCTKEAVLKLSGVGLKAGPKTVRCPATLIEGASHADIEFRGRNILVQMCQRGPFIIALASGDR